MATSLMLIMPCLLCFCLQFTIASTDDGNWCGQDGTKVCCAGFYEENNTCLECVGAHSINCSEPCPASYYGGSCKLKCHCVITECDRIRGCPEETLKANRWVVVTVVVLVLFLVVSCIMIVKNKQNRNNGRTQGNYINHSLPEEDGDYLNVFVIPQASTEYLNSFELKRPTDNYDYLHRYCKSGSFSETQI
ncbi:N-acetylglucosamine-1-phosphodiester alpha-N-acetylglucosaminidase-like isoform X2 [Ostrea edulis]|uniref:N-acetylglucosamine-1-phosphodiester alpha-N-acetylglucosaminidase-like isoform X2 n=1 Tax=Ostrea edulis TaxID=37623 RepID=UPI0020944EA6|nr:N-acetylglucosamine-1-phosphodiester alpha-N-acetylglucosaminidase-like isoform X2 [Ostrea edulis]